MKARLIILSIFSLISFASFAEETVSYGELFSSSLSGYSNHVWNEITFQTGFVNYFWWLVVLSILVWGLEIAFPWRKNQAIIRKDFWIDTFYMFFNFFIFRLVVFAGLVAITDKGFTELMGGDLSSFALVKLSDLAVWQQLLIFFLAMDFIQWFTHVMLHRFNFLWRFHKVHHSVEEMGFAAHLRYHWMENIFYTPVKYIILMLLGGVDPQNAFIVYYISTAIGHINHANLDISYGPLKYIFNNPKMHIWHHAYELPEERKRGVNFGISLSIWDYIFKTNYIPSDGRDIRLGFENISKFPKRFFGQLFYGFGKGRDEK